MSTLSTVLSIYMLIHLTLTQPYDVRTSNFTNEEAESYVFKDVYRILNEEGNPRQSHVGSEYMWLRSKLAFTCIRAPDKQQV